MPDLYTSHLLISASLHFEENCLHPETMKNSLFNLNNVFVAFSHVKQTEQNMLKVRLINKLIMASIGHNCVKTQRTNNINVLRQSKHRYGKLRAGHFSDTQGSCSTSFSAQGHGAEWFDRASCQIPPCINYG